MFNYFYKNFMWSLSSLNLLTHKGKKKKKACDLKIECREESMQNKNRNCSLPE